MYQLLKPTQELGQKKELKHHCDKYHYTVTLFMIEFTELVSKVAHPPPAAFIPFKFNISIP